MLFPQPLRRGRLIRRYKRFLADVRMDDGEETTVHTPNPGAMLGLAEPGLTVWCSKARSAGRKLAYTWELVEALHPEAPQGAAGPVLVGVNTQSPNAIAAEALAAGAMVELLGYDTVRREVAYGEASRVDFLLETPSRPRCWLEIKNCHLSRRSGLAEFPDCVAARSSKHLAELRAMVEAGDRAAVLFVVQRADCQAFEAAADIDPTFAAALAKAAQAGVEVLVYGCDVGLEGVTLVRRLPWTGDRRGA
jgi:sugar fermentation stimulation protein A